MGRIESQQLVAPKVFKPLRDEIELTEKSLKTLSKSLKDAVKAENNLAKTTKKTAKGYTELAGAQKRQKKALTESAKVEKRIITLREKLTKVSKLQKERETALRVELARRNKVMKQQAILANKNIGAFEKLGVKIKTLSTKYKDLIVQEGKETKATRKLRKEILSLNKVRNQANENLGNHQHKVGKYTGVISKLRGGLAQLGLAFGVFQLLKGTFNIVKDFDTAMGDLAAITGKTTAELAPLKEQALELGATTQFTASQVAELQLELAKLGFTTEQITASTGPISKFATATGADMADAAALAGSSLRAFGLDASEMERVVSVLAVATTKTALDFGFLQTAMATIAPVANAFGFSIEDSTALLGQLANAGFDASSAATATRNILLNLADANGSLAKELGRPITSADDLAGALIELKDKGIDLATALELTDKRSVAAFETFLNGSDSLVELRDSITGVSGELDEMSAKKLDTISGATDLLKSAWEGLILQWNEGAGAGETLKNIIKFIADNLGTILKVVGAAIKLFAAYKVGVKAAAIQTKLFGEATSKLGKAFGGPLLLAITAVILLIGQMVKSYQAAWREGKALEDVTKKVNEAMVEEQAELKKTFVELAKTTAGTKEREEGLDRLNEKYGLTLQNLEDENVLVHQLSSAYEGLVNEMKKRIALQVVEEEISEKFKELFTLELQLKEAEKSAFSGFEGATELFTGVNVTESIKGQIADTKSAINELFRLQGFLEEDRGGLGKAESDRTGPRFREGDTIGSTGVGGGVNKVVDEERIKLDKLNALRKRNELILLEGEKKLIQRGVDKEQRDFILSQKRIELMRKESELIVELDFRDKGILIKQENAYFKFIEANQIKRVDVHKDANDDIEEDAKLMFKELEKQPPKFLDILGEAFNDLRDEIAETARLLAKLGENRLVQLDAQHDAEQRNFDESKSREQELKDLAKEKGLDASESIRVERENQKAALEAQRKIAEEKAKTTALLALVTAWAAQVQSGQGNPVANVKASFNDLKGFVEGSFYTGTEHTLADALGGTGTRDGHIIRADDNEAIFTGQQTSDLGIHKGGNSTQDIVNMYKGGILGASVRGGMGVDVKTMPTQNNKELIREVKKLVSNTNPANQKSDGTTFNVLTGMLEKQRRNGGKIRYQTRN
jgi:TP901 family phage tail tape measure protein